MSRKTKCRPLHRQPKLIAADHYDPAESIFCYVRHHTAATSATRGPGAMHSSHLEDEASRIGLHMHA